MANSFFFFQFHFSGVNSISAPILTFADAMIIKVFSNAEAARLFPNSSAVVIFDKGSYQIKYLHKLQLLNYEKR